MNETGSGLSPVGNESDAVPLTFLTLAFQNCAPGGHVYDGAADIGFLPDVGLVGYHLELEWGLLGEAAEDDTCTHTNEQQGLAFHDMISVAHTTGIINLDRFRR